MIHWFIKERQLEHLKEISKNTVLELADITIDQITDEEIIGSMPVDDRTVQPMRLLHGGMSCTLAESLGSLGSYLLVDPQKYIIVGQSIQANHLRPAIQGRVTGRAHPIHVGRRSHVWEISIFNEEEKLVSVSRLTVAVLEKPV
jgi:1,4-dihydroxy-2-naphthoyl-CoA hydrolase